MGPTCSHTASEAKTCVLCLCMETKQLTEDLWTGLAKVIGRVEALENGDGSEAIKRTECGDKTGWRRCIDPAKCNNFHRTVLVVSEEK